MRVFLCFNLILWTCWACCSKKPADNQHPDKQILAEIFPALVDSLYIISEAEMVPPMPLRSDGSRFSEREIDSFYNFWKQRTRNWIYGTHKESWRRSIYVSTSVVPFSDKGIDDVIGYLGQLDSTHYKTATTKPYVTDFKTLSLSKAFKLDRLDSTSYKRSGTYEPCLPVYPPRNIIPSRIVLNKTHTKAILSCAISHSSSSEVNYIIYLKKKGNHWLIDRIQEGSRLVA